MAPLNGTPAEHPFQFGRRPLPLHREHYPHGTNPLMEHLFNPARHDEQGPGALAAILARLGESAPAAVHSFDPTRIGPQFPTLPESTFPGLPEPAGNEMMQPGSGFEELLHGHPNPLARRGIDLSGAGQRNLGPNAGGGSALARAAGGGGMRAY